jgi:hypothetical protein
MAPIMWDTRLATRLGSEITTPSYDGSVVNASLKHAFDRRWSIPMNGIEEYSFKLYLDDPAAAVIETRKHVIRVWRHINDTIYGKTRTPPAGTPDFCGFVSGIRRNGQEGTMEITVQSPLWKLQAHFHINNHRLVKDSPALINPPNYEGGNGDGLPWDQSALMFRIIDQIQGAFKNSGSDIGIRKPLGSAPFWPKSIQMSPFFIAKGSNVWANVERILNSASAPDLLPEYIWTPGSVNTMYFKTVKERGTDRSGSLSFNYRIGNSNLANISETQGIEPGRHGNYGWTIGDGGPNGPAVTVWADVQDRLEYGLYMVRNDVGGAKLADVSKMKDPHLALALAAGNPVYSIGLAPMIPPYYGVDWFLGDQIMLNATRGYWNVSNKKQRIYQVDLEMSNNNVETCSAHITDDFKRRFP